MENLLFALGVLADVWL